MTIAMTITNLAVDTTTIEAADVTGPDNQLLTHLNNLANGSQDVEAIRWQEISKPSTPASTKWKLYFKTGGLYILDDAGTESQVTTGSSSYSLTLSDILLTQVFS